MLYDPNQNPSDIGEPCNISRIPYPYLQMFFTFDYRSVSDYIIDPYRHTCSWIPTSEAFVKWIAGEYSRTLWLHGYPGLGKSVITKYLLKNVFDTPRVNKSSRPCVLYFFCSYRHSNTRSYKGLVSSLIHQLLSQNLGLAGETKYLKKKKILSPPNRM